MCDTYVYGCTSVNPAGNGNYTLNCTRCGEVVTYSLRAFTLCEAQRHENWCSKHKGTGKTVVLNCDRVFK